VYNIIVHQLQRSLQYVPGSIPGTGHLCRYVTNQPPKANSAFHPSGVGNWVPGKAKAGMVHSVSGWTRGVQVKLWDPLRTRAIPERLRGVFTTRRCTNPRLPLLLPDHTRAAAANDPKWRKAAPKKVHFEVTAGAGDNSWTFRRQTSSLITHYADKAIRWQDDKIAPASTSSFIWRAVDEMSCQHGRRSREDRGDNSPHNLE